MKKCCRCKEEKSEVEFNKKTSNPDGLERYCKECHRKKNQRHYQNNKKKYKTSANKHKRDRRSWYQEIKSTLKCFICSEDKPWRLGFHHLDPTEKELEISLMISKGTSKQKIIEEMNKCIVVCHNCHADIHHKLNNQRSE